MRTTNVFHGLGIGLLICTLPALSVTAFSEPVSEDEAVAVSELWLWMEINDPHHELTELEKDAWLLRLEEPQVHYLLAGDVLLDEPPADDEVLAYIVAYDPGAFVVLTADDRLEPVLVFDTHAPFRGDRVPENFLRDFLARNVPARWAYLRTRLKDGIVVGVHPDWLRLRQQLLDQSDADSAGARQRADSILWDTALWGQGWPYNTEVAAHNGGIACPTGCTATAMAIQMRFHSWPITGYGAHCYTDNGGDVQFTHCASFETTTYEWANMPTADLTQENFDVAQLMYHCGVAVEMDYEQDGSGAWPSAEATNTFFRYRGTIEVTSGDQEPIITSIRAGLPVVLSSSTHTVVACGHRYSPPPFFYLNCGWSGSNNGWYNVDQIPGGDPTIDASYPYSSPDNYVFVDGDYQGPQYGDLQYPFNTVAAGHLHVPNGGRLCIKGGSYDETITFSRLMTITNYEGTVTIGSP